MLRFQAKAGSMGVQLAALPFRRAVQKVAAVKLNARFRCEDFQKSPAHRLKNFCGELQSSFWRSFQDPVVVVVLPNFNCSSP